MMTSSRLATLRLILGGLLILTLQAALDIYRQIRDLGVAFSLTSQMWLLLFGFVLVCLIEQAALLLTWTRQRQRMLALASQIVQLLPANKIVVLSLLIVVVIGFASLVLFPWGDIFGTDAFRWLLFGFVVILATLLLRRLLPAANWLNLLAVTILTVSSAYRLFQFIPDISVYPFSLGWSEASRYYYASLFFSEKIYGFRVPTSTLHPTRYLMQSLPFLVDGLPLWFHRFWQVILWLGTLFGTALLLARRLKVTGKVWWWLFSAWGFLFLWQGPVYYHLLVIVMIVLWGFDAHRFWRSLVVILLASAWAGISRVNWFPVPGMLAIILYFIEKPKNADQPLWRYLLPPAVWAALGFGMALLAQSLYIVWSGNDPEMFASSFSSALLWYRLFPNPTYPLGVMTGAILISLPVFFLVAWRLRRKSVSLHLIAWLGMAAILGVLLVGGLVVSTKIGGGSNLHNIDAYLALLLVVGAYFYFERIRMLPESTAPQVGPPAWLNLFLVFIPAFFALGTSTHFVQYRPETAAESLFKMQRVIERTLEDGGEILFISERQLLTFDYIEGVTLVPEYEKVFLMEMVMAGNRNYLETFEEDISTQRFDLIITDPLFDNYKDVGENWAEENNVWVEAVSVPILCHYWRKVTFPESGVQIMAPREKAIDCSQALDADSQP